MKSLVTQHAQQYAVSIFQNLPDSSWSRYYGSIEKGIELSFINPGNSKQLGNIVTAIPYVDIPLFPSKNNLTHLKIGVGLGYVSAPFHPLDNFQNVAIGSHFNAAILFELNQSISLKNKHDLQLAFRFNHLSNGAFKTPNLGYNIPMLAAGYSFGKKKGEKTAKRWNGDIKLTLQLMAAYGLKENLPSGGKKHSVVALMPSYLYRLGYKTSLGVFGEWVSNSAIAPKLPPSDPRDNRQWAMGVAANFHFDKVSLWIHSGVYLKNDDPDVGSTLSRLGVKYFWTPRWFSLIYLKSHSFKADHVGLGLGYCINE